MQSDAYKYRSRTTKRVFFFAMAWHASLLLLVAAVAAAAVAAPLPGDERSGPLRVLVACGWHGREWATVRLCEAWQRRVEELRAHTIAEVRPSWVEWRFIHAVNKDGVRIAQQEGHACHRGNAAGVDLNRNFPPIKACPDGTEPRAPRYLTRAGRDAEEYPGPAPESERETLEYEAEVRAFAPDMVLLVHTGTEGILLPYDACFEPAPSDVFLRQKAIANRMARAARVDPGRVGTLSNKIGYAAVPTAADWTFAEADAPFTFTLETYLTPAKCDAGARVRQLKTANMSDDECTLTFVPHHPETCRVDLEHYVKRWLPLVDAVERLTHGDKDRKTLEAWLDKYILPLEK